MKWERGHQSSHVEDRRGQRARGRGVAIGGGAAVLVALVGLIAQALGVDVTGLLGSGGSSGAGAPSSASSGSATGGGIPKEQDPDRELYEFVSFAIDDIQDGFARKFAEAGKRYEPADLVVFTDEVDTGCGLSSSAIGPFYCPPDRKAYIDLSFYKVLKDKLGAGGDFAEAYVLAHEIGHHVQNLLGVDAQVAQQVQRDPRQQNTLSVRQELQADCFAGVWASTTKQRILEDGDIEESVNAAAQIGDDRLQKMAGEKVNPETWTHGSSAQRVKWFKIGLESGTLDRCDTFSGTP